MQREGLIKGTYHDSPCCERYPFYWFQVQAKYITVHDTKQLSLHLSFFFQLHYNFSIEGHLYHSKSALYIDVHIAIMFMYTNVQHNQLTTTNICLHYELWQDISLASCTVSVVAFIGHKVSMYQLEQSFATQLLWPIDFSKLGCALMHGPLFYIHQHIYTLFSFKSAIASSKLKQINYNYHDNSHVQYLPKAQCQWGIALYGDSWNMWPVMTNIARPDMQRKGTYLISKQLFTYLCI